MATDRTTVCALLKPDEFHALQALEDLERLNRSDIIRRALWHYAQHMGVVPGPALKPKPETK